MVGKRGRSLQERFENFYIPEPNTGCWLWIGGCEGKGYGEMWNGVSGPAKAHHVAYRLYKGDIPPGLMLRHKCDVRSCVNPDHLVLGSAQDNVNDAVERGRHARGARHGAAKLTEEQVERILRAKARWSNAYLAALFGVSQETIGGIRKRRKWKHVSIA